MPPSLTLMGVGGWGLGGALRGPQTVAVPANRCRIGARQDDKEGEANEPLWIGQGLGRVVEGGVGRGEAGEGDDAAAVLGVVEDEEAAAGLRAALPHKLRFCPAPPATQPFPVRPQRKAKERPDLACRRVTSLRARKTARKRRARKAMLELTRTKTAVWKPTTSRPTADTQHPSQSRTERTGD